MNYKKFTQQYLHQWMQENNLEGDYLIHHRDDNDEVREYNKHHYELWGFEIDENGEACFEEGKYIIFMTRSEHNGHHARQRTGERNPMYGKHHTDETKQKMSEALSGENHPMYGKTHSEESRKKISTQVQLNRIRYDAYIANGGTLSWNDFLHAIKIGELTLEQFMN